MKSVQQKRREPPALYLEQLALDELPAERVRELEAEFGAELLARKRAELLTDNEALRARFARAALPSAERLERYRAAEAARRRRSRWLSFDLSLQRLVLAGSGLLVVLAALIVIAPRETRESADGVAPRPGAEATRVKGLAPRLLCFRQRGDVVEPLSGGAAVRAGDLLQLGYVPAGRTHGVLLSIDGRGAVSLHFPAPPSSDTRLAKGGESLLGHAYELDDAPGFERFFLVTSRAPLDVSAVRAAARELASDPQRARKGPLALPADLPADVEQKSLLLRKVAP